MSDTEQEGLPESNSRMDSDWPFVEKVLDLTEGHSNSLRAKMIIEVLSQLSQRRRADLVEAVSDVKPRSAQEEAAWLLAIGKPIPGS